MAKKPAGKRSSNVALAASARATKKLKIVIEGDSWERLPNWGPKGLPVVGGTNYDLCRALDDRGHKVENLAYWGDTIKAIATANDYMEALRKTKWPLLLLGGGGNDLLANGKLKTYLRLYVPESGYGPRDYILNNFYQDLRSIILNYERILDRIAADPVTARTRVIVHGYDYAKPMDLGWLGEPLDFAGFTYWHAELRNGIVKVLIDEFNRELAALATRHKNVIHVDFRSRVGDRWHDELHPTKPAFMDLARFLEAEVVK